jgi:hypothetical protein
VNKLARLLLFVALACGSAVSQQPAKTAGPTNIQPEAPYGVEVLNAKWEMSSRPSAFGPGTSPLGDDNRPALPHLPTVGTSPGTKFYVYSADIRNEGAKAIRAIAWDFVFTDPVTNEELRRHALASLQNIHVHQKKTLHFRTQAAPPPVVNVAALEKDKRTPFNQNVVLECIQFSDGTFWQRPNAKRNPCRSLDRWVARRQKRGPSREDLPISPK